MQRVWCSGSGAEGLVQRIWLPRPALEWLLVLNDFGQTVRGTFEDTSSSSERQEISWSATRVDPATVMIG